MLPDIVCLHFLLELKFDNFVVGTISEQDLGMFDLVCAFTFSKCFQHFFLICFQQIVFFLMFLKAAWNSFSVKAEC